MDTWWSNLFVIVDTITKILTESLMKGNQIVISLNCIDSNNITTLQCEDCGRPKHFFCLVEDKRIRRIFKTNF